MRIKDTAKRAAKAPRASNSLVYVFAESKLATPGLAPLRTGSGSRAALYLAEALVGVGVYPFPSATTTTLPSTVLLPHSSLSPSSLPRLAAPSLRIAGALNHRRARPGEIAVAAAALPLPSLLRRVFGPVSSLGHRVSLTLNPN